MAAHSPPRGSRRPFPRFPVSMGSTPCVIFDSQHNRACCYALLQEDLLSECSRPYDNLSCLCFTALWQSQSMLVWESQPAKDVVLTCFKTFPIKATTCLQVVPMSLHWPVDPIARFDQSCLSLAFPWRSQWRTSRRRSSSSITCTLEAGCSSTTSSTAWYCRSGYMSPLLRRRSAMYHLEHLVSRWIGFFFAEKQGAQTQKIQEAP